MWPSIKKMHTIVLGFGAEINWEKDHYFLFFFRGIFDDLYLAFYISRKVGGHYREARLECKRHLVDFVLGVVYLLSCVWLFATPWTVVHQAPLFMGFPGENTGVACHIFLQGIFLTQGSNLRLMHWQAGSLLLSHQVDLQRHKKAIFQ